MDINSLDMASANSLLPTRAPDGNKGTFGNVLLICGSARMVGCCVLATLGALRSGAGLVTLAFPDVLYTPLTSRLTENLFLSLQTDEHGFIGDASLSALRPAIEKADTVMVGCGIGTGKGARLITRMLLDYPDKPIIFDADALNCISLSVRMLNDARCNSLLTPHPGEMARLSGKTVAEVEADREKCVTDFCEKYGVNLLLKGKNTLICNSDTSCVFVNKTGNTGLSKGGSGDLLSGIIAGLTPSMGGNLFNAAVLGAFAHGMTADILKNDFSERAILPTDCASVLPEVYKIIEKGAVR